MSKQLLSSILITGVVILILGVLPGVTTARPAEDMAIHAPFFSRATLTYNGNPLQFPVGDTYSEPVETLLLDYNWRADVYSSSPFAMHIATVGVQYIDDKQTELGASYYLGGIHEGEELLVNVSPYQTRELGIDPWDYTNYNYSTNSSLSHPRPVINIIKLSDDVVVYNVSWRGFIYYYSREDRAYFEEPTGLYDYPMNITFVRIKPNDPLANLTEVRDFYANVYPAHWNSPVLKVPCVLVTDDNNVVVKALIVSEWDPASIGLTKQQADEWVFYTYGVWPTYV